MMSNLSGRSIIILILLLMTQIYQIAAAQTIDERPLNAQKQAAITCPSLVRANNWEIEKFFGTWTGIEMFVHNVHGENSSSETFEDSCMNIRVVEVNELNEEMTYGKAIDPFNFRIALRHLRVEFTRDNKVTEFLLSFNNSNQMLWFGNEVVMQIIKFDGTQMMITVCEKQKRELYTISAYRTYDSSDKEANVSNKNGLILQGRNLKIYSKHNLRLNCVIADSSGQFNSGVMFLNSVMLFVSSVVFQMFVL